MPAITIVYGLVLILLGVGGYFATGQESVTALIPAFFGIPVLLSGFVARNERYMKHAMHGAAILALLGVFGTAKGLLSIGSALSGEAERPAAIYAQSIMAVVSLLFVVLCVRSFIAARKAREATAA